MNEYVSRDVPGYATVLGTANPSATVTVNLQRAYRYGSYFQDELVVTNTGGPLFVALTNLAVLNNGTNADIVTTNLGNLYVPQTPETFGYDLDGNLTNSGRWTIAWDAENRALSFASIAGAPTAAKRKVDCIYDYQGRRVQKIVSTNNGTSYVAISTNRYVYDGWNLIAILNADSSLQSTFTWGLDLSGSPQGAGGVGGLISMTEYVGTNAGAYFYAYDGNGNVASVVNTLSGTLAGQWEYDPFGNALRSTGQMASSNPFQFSTKFFDAETSLSYYGYRYYDSNTGRWLSRDPIQERGGLNLYGFTDNTPENLVDVLGLDTNVYPGGNPLDPWPYFKAPSWFRDVPKMDSVSGAYLTGFIEGLGELFRNKAYRQCYSMCAFDSGLNALTGPISIFVEFHPFHDGYEEDPEKSKLLEWQFSKLETAKTTSEFADEKVSEQVAKNAAREKVIVPRIKRYQASGSNIKRLEELSAELKKIQQTKGLQKTIKIAGKALEVGNLIEVFDKFDECYKKCRCKTDDSED